MTEPDTQMHQVEVLPDELLEKLNVAVDHASAIYDSARDAYVQLVELRDYCKKFAPSDGQLARDQR